MFSNIPQAEIWNECLDLAITGFNQGSMGISAVIINGNSKVVSCGRNHISINDSSDKEIFGSSIAHAEINAIHGLKENSLIGSNFTLFTTVEPCPMCMGAIIMSRIKNVVIASKDPHAGSMKYLNFSDYSKSKEIKYCFIKGKVEKVFFILHYLSIMRVMKGKKQHAVFDNMKKEYKEYIDFMENNLQIYEIERFKISKEWLESIVKDIL